MISRLVTESTFCYFAGIINMEDGKQGLVELQETRIFILEHSVSLFSNL